MTREAITLIFRGDFRSEDEEDSEEREGHDNSELTLPRALRMFFEPEDDTLEEAKAAGHIDVLQFHPTPEPSQVDPGELHGPSSLFDFSWRSYPRDPLSPAERRELFLGHSGPTIERTTNPYDIFTKIWDTSIMGHIVTQTNLYAQENAANLLNLGLIGPRSRISEWVETNIDEMYIYFAMILAMGVLFKSKMEEYWCKEGNIFTTPYFSCYMSLNRFQLLNRCINFNDNTLLSPDLSPKERKLFKIAPLVAHLNFKFSALFNLH
ncbi:unnamed protein product [Parnassius apollo]|uniref:(apollo) hypothetical protein n=1 Tax=Parnassius apollo TaxID=110799 RepID=A0A8S3WG35_PARAO|nr:unnamed protein product [Parnassius apollo]